MSCKVDLHEARARLKFLGDTIMYLGKQECYWRDHLYFKPTAISIMYYLMLGV